MRHKHFEGFFYISELGEIKKKIYVQGERERERAMDGWEGGWRDEGRH